LNEELDKLIQELTDAGASDDEIAAILDERLKQPTTTASAQASVGQPVQANVQPQTKSEPHQYRGFKGISPEQREASGIDDMIPNAIKSLNRGVSQVVSEPLKLLGAGEEYIDTKINNLFGKEAPPSYFGSTGNKVTEVVNEINPLTDEYQQSTTGQVFQGLGQAGGMIATMGGSTIPAIASQAVVKTGLAPATLQTLQAVGKSAVSRPGIVGGSMVAAPEWEAAKANGLSDEAAFNVLIQNYLVGQTEVLPIQSMLSKLNRVTGNSLINTFKNIGTGGLQEGVQEGIQTYLTNEIAKGSYDPDRDPLFQVLESAKVGGIVGMILPGIGSVVQNTQSPELKQKLAMKVIDLSAEDAINENKSGDENADAIIKNAAQFTPAEQQLAEGLTDAVNNETITAEGAVNESVQETPVITETKQAPKSEQGTLGEQLVGKEEVVTPEPAIEPVATNDLVNQFNEEGALLGATEESKKETKAVATEQIADFLRGKVSSRGQVIDFVEQWNELHPERTITDTDGNNAWNLIKPIKPQVSNETVTQTTAQALKDQIKTFYRGVDKGVRKGQQLVNETLIPKVQDALKTSNLSPRQTSAILTKLKRTNLFTPGSINKLNTYIDKVTANADYADKVDQAESLRSKIKSQAKSKAIPQNIRTVSREFAKLDVDNFDIEEYLPLAEHVSNNLTSPKGNKYTGFDEFKVTQKINEGRQAQEKAQLSEMLGDFGDFDVDEIIMNDGSIEEALKGREDKRKEVTDALRAKADFAKIGLENIGEEAELDSEEKEIISTLIGADTADMNADDMVAFVRTADNIALNNDFSGSGVIGAKLKAKDVAKTFKNMARNNREAGAIRQDFYSIGQLLDTMINNNRTVAEFEQTSGIAGILEAGSVTNNMTTEKMDQFKDFLKTLKNKYKGKSDVTHIEEQWKAVILRELARNTDEISHINKVRANLERSIQLYSTTEPELGKKLKDYYDQYKGVTNSTEAIEQFQKKDPQIYDVWKWFRDNVFDETLARAAEKNTNNIYNQALVSESNYLPSSQKRIQEQAKEADDQDSKPVISLKPQQAKNTLKATRSLAQGNAYDLNFFGSMFKAYHNTLYDINSAKDIQLFYEVSKRPEFEEVIGGEKNKNKLIKTLGKRLADQRGDTQSEGEFVKFFNNISHILKDLGVAKALGGVDQLATQTVPTWISATINLGKDADLMWAQVPDSFVKGVIGKGRTSEAGKRKGGTDLGESSERYLADDAKGVNKFLESIRRGVKSAADFSLIPLTGGDVFVRKQAFAGFYVQRLRELGVNPKEINLSTEATKQNEEVRKKARAYADHMVATLQVPSNRAEMGEFLTKKGGWDTLRTILFPFSVFPINTKVRFGRAIKKLETNPAEGRKELTAVVAESISFGAIKTYFLAAIVYPAIQSLIRKGLDVEEPEKEEDREEDFWYNVFGGLDATKNFRKLSTSVYNDLAPTSIGPGTALTSYMTNRSAYYLRNQEQYGEYSYDDWLAETRGLVNQPYESEFSNWGVLGVGIQQLKDIGDAGYDMASTAAGAETIYLNTLFGSQEVETEGVEDLIYWNALLEGASIVTPREFDNAWNKVYTEQLKDYTPNKRRARRQSEGE